MTNKPEQSIDAATDNTNPLVDATQGRKPRLLVEDSNPDQTVAALRDLLANESGLYCRSVPVRIVHDQMQGGSLAQVMTADGLILKAHTICRPYIRRQQKDGTVLETNVRLPRAMAAMYLECRGDWQLPPLNGISSAPLLREDGTICSVAGYDRASGMWCENAPDLTGYVPNVPTAEQAATALLLIREAFRTVCFADARMVEHAGMAVVDTQLPPAKDESAFLVGLLTAVCRPSLLLAPGLLIRAASMSGAGVGKGLIARCISSIAYGREPHAVTGGRNIDELEKRIAAELIEGSPTLFLDNLNNMAFRSDLLASAITERPARVRLLGRSQMMLLNPSAMVMLTGNGLTVSEDLVRRFVMLELDSRTEDPEARSFNNDIRAEIWRRRNELLGAALTIWRWGRMAQGIVPGRQLGSFEQWSSWVRDPLLALGCQDPAKRISEAKQRDHRRQEIAELFSIWMARHQERPVAVRDLHDDIKQILDPQGRGRQFLAAQLANLVGTRVSNFCLSRQSSIGKWGSATYALAPDQPRGVIVQREYSRIGPKPPKPPMPLSKEICKS